VLLTPQHYHWYAAILDSPSTEGSWQIVLKQATKWVVFSSGHYDSILSFMKVDALWCENSGARDMNPRTVGRRACVLSTTYTTAPYRRHLAPYMSRSHNDLFVEIYSWHTLIFHWYRNINLEYPRSNVATSRDHHYQCKVLSYLLTYLLTGKY